MTIIPNTLPQNPKESPNTIASLWKERDKMNTSQWREFPTHFSIQKRVYLQLPTFLTTPFFNQFIHVSSYNFNNSFHHFEVILDLVTSGTQISHHSLHYIYQLEQFSTMHGHLWSTSISTLLRGSNYTKTHYLLLNFSYF